MLHLHLYNLDGKHVHTTALSPEFEADLPTGLSSYFLRSKMWLSRYLSAQQLTNAIPDRLPGGYGWHAAGTFGWGPPRRPLHHQPLCRQRQAQSRPRHHPLAYG